MKRRMDLGGKDVEMGKHSDVRVVITHRIIVIVIILFLVIIMSWVSLFSCVGVLFLRNF